MINAALLSHTDQQDHAANPLLGALQDAYIRLYDRKEGVAEGTA